MSKKSSKLMDQQRAVMSYLEDLLLEVPDTPLEEEVPDNVVTAFPRPEPVQETVTEIQQAPVAVPEPAPVETPKQEVPVAAAVETKNKADNVPQWAEEEFQCLMFSVVGISLAVPLMTLNGVIPWSKELTPMPGHSPAFLGLLRHLDKNVKVMDTARVILPPAQMQQVADQDERLHKIILMDEGRWGLACDNVGEVITLQASDVRWRSEAGKRPWLAGTISERLCALLDTEVMAQILTDGKE